MSFFLYEYDEYFYLFWFGKWLLCVCDDYVVYVIGDVYGCVDLLDVLIM